MTTKNVRFHGGPIDGALQPLEVEEDGFRRAFVERLINLDGRIFSQVCLYTPVHEAEDCIIVYLHAVEIAAVDGRKH